jgi:hypothetical protein
MLCGSNFTFTMGRPCSMYLSVRWTELRDESQRFLSPLIAVCLLLVSNSKGMETRLSKKKENIKPTRLAVYLQ